MLTMKRIVFIAACLLLATSCGHRGEKRPKHSSFDYEVAETHEIKPHRRMIPTEGIDWSNWGTTQLRLTLTVSPTGDVMRAEASGDPKALKFWPLLMIEAHAWKFKPFELDGKAVTAEVEEYIDLVPPERLPANHAIAPVVRPDSKVAITLRRTGCFGSCPSYIVTVGSDGIIFDGDGFVAASGKHTAQVDADEVRKLAKRFVGVDFYSMDGKYEASVTDIPGYALSVEIDGRKKEVFDIGGEWAGMPAVISELEEAVDVLARSERWVSGSEGLVEALRSEKFNFQSYEAQVMLKEAANRGKAETVREFLEAGVPLKPIPAPKPIHPNTSDPFGGVGWLEAASSHADVLKVLIDATASKDDQRDKDLALTDAANIGNIEGARSLIAYGANPNVDLSKLTVTEIRHGKSMKIPIAGSVLTSAAASGNPEMVREILRYHPNLETSDRDGRTALFSAAESRYRDKEGSRVQCLQLLVKAGAKVNASDKGGNTVLHKVYPNELAEELLRLGADVNARNKFGETPIFTTLNDGAIPLLIDHGADLTIRNKKGQTVMEAAKEKGSSREKVLREAIEKMKKEKQ
jgi:ankyrin repeat protein